MRLGKGEVRASTTLCNKANQVANDCNGLRAAVCPKCSGWRVRAQGDHWGVCSESSGFDWEGLPFLAISQILKMDQLHRIAEGALRRRPASHSQCTIRVASERRGSSTLCGLNFLNRRDIGSDPELLGQTFDIFFVGLAVFHRQELFGIGTSGTTQFICGFRGSCNDRWRCTTASCGLHPKTRHGGIRDTWRRHDAGQFRQVQGPYIRCPTCAVREYLETLDDPDSSGSCPAQHDGALYAFCDQNLPRHCQPF